MKYLIFNILLILSPASYAQHKLEGVVGDKNGLPITGANVYIKGTYNGTITDPEGHFRLVSASASDSLLVISFIGYERQEIPIRNAPAHMNIVLAEVSDKLDEIVITAGSFEASEENRAVLLNPIEIATTASSDGDVYGALSTFPGAQKSGETGQLIVRGGEAYETKTYIDGMLVSSPYGSSMPDLPGRGRFTPFMFNGVMFSTGGYSAEYGQALSSVLELQTPGIFDEDVTGISLMNVGGGISHTRRNTRSGYSAELMYNNTYPYFAMAKHDLNWTKTPQNIDGKFYYRHKIGKTGLLKADAITNYGSSELDYSKMDYGYKKVGLVNDNQLVKTTYTTGIGEKWMLKSGIALNRNRDITKLDSDKLRETLSTLHMKLSLVNYTNDKVTFRLGSDANYLDYQFQFRVDSSAAEYKMAVQDWIVASYMEADVRLHKNVALRIGGRSEYSGYTGKANLAPRASMACKINENSQVSFAWGQFYQQDSYDYLKYTDQLEFEQAQHLLINYQYQKSRRVFRTELYQKNYKNLITFTPGQYAEFENLANKGEGYARGIDIFWKDNATFRNTSYWVSYSYIDSERKYRDYPERATPHFVAPHNLSVVGKYWLSAITTQFAATYTFSSGRSYYNPNHADFMSDRTPSVHDLSVNASYVTDWFGWMTVVHLSVSNVLGQEHIYSYRYADTPDEFGVYRASAVKNHVRRTVIIGVFVSID